MISGELMYVYISQADITSGTRKHPPPPQRARAQKAYALLKTSDFYLNSGIWEQTYCSGAVRFVAARAKSPSGALQSRGPERYYGTSAWFPAVGVVLFEGRV